MAKFPFKRPRIISKKFPGVNSAIDGVSKSLNELVFSYSKQVDQTLQKKHLMMAFSSIVLLIVLGSFISPKGKADSSIFFPETCLGGWVNPQYAQGEQETTSNGDESQFTKDNSAVLPKNTNAEMYCGNFKGKFNGATKPTKIIVSLALTKGKDLTAEDTMESGLSASSSPKVLLASTTIPSLLNASSTASSTFVEVLVISEDISATTTASTTVMIDAASSSETRDTTATPTPIVAPDAPSSIMNGIIESVKDTIRNLFDPKTDPVPQGTTDTVVVPPPAPVEVPAPVSPPTQEVAPPTEPTSYLPYFRENVISMLFQKVFAQETPLQAEDNPLITPIDTPPAPNPNVEASPLEVSPVTTTSTQETSPQIVGSPDPLPIIESTSTIDNSASTTTPQVGTSTLATIASSTIATTTIDVATTTADIATTTEDENQFQNNFLEIFYTFDGVTWISLGELNEISMKYRNFEIPVTATTSWISLNNLQIKIVAKIQLEETPTIYLDGIKVEVLYESVIEHSHPDFARDIVLKDQSDDGVRVVNIINSDTGVNEIWYTTLDSQGSYGVAPGTWVQVNLEQVSTTYQLIDIYSQNIFWIDDSQKMLWVTNIEKQTNDGIGLILPPEMLAPSVLVATSTEASSTSLMSSAEGSGVALPAPPLVPDVASTAASFVKANGEEWVFEYNSVTKKITKRIKN